MSEAIHRLRRARELAGLSLTQAARKLGWDGLSLEEHETGACAALRWPLSDDEWSRLADLYGVTVAWLRGADVELPEATREVLRQVEHNGDRARLTELLEAVQGAPK